MTCDLWLVTCDFSVFSFYFQPLFWFVFLTIYGFFLFYCATVKKKFLTFNFSYCFVQRYSIVLFNIILLFLFFVYVFSKIISIPLLLWHFVKYFLKIYFSLMILYFMIFYTYVYIINFHNFFILPCYLTDFPLFELMTQLPSL